MAMFLEVKREEERGGREKRRQTRWKYGTQKCQMLAKLAPPELEVPTGEVSKGGDPLFHSETHSLTQIFTR